VFSVSVHKEAVKMKKLARCFKFDLFPAKNKKKKKTT